MSIKGTSKKLSDKSRGEGSKACKPPSREKKKVRVGPFRNKRGGKGKGAKVNVRSVCLVRIRMSKNKRIKRDVYQQRN